jgi:prepilin-type N-terminal cleavage/methylation domain-containing protein
MRFSSRCQDGFTLVELMVTAAVIGVVGLVLYSLLNINMILGAKNTAINTTHEQVRVAMLDMLRDLHSAVSAPVLTDSTGTPYSSPPASGYAEGIAFQKWASGPYSIKADALTNQKVIHVALVATPGQQNIPIYYGTRTQKLIVPTYQIEDYITAISGTRSDLSITLTNNLPIAIKGTTSTAGHVVCFITDSCSYTVSNNTLKWNYRGVSYSKSTGNSITNLTPFYIPPGAVGAAFNSLGTSDLKSSNRGYKSVNIMLNGQAPIKAQLTTYQ